MRLCIEKSFQISKACPVFLIDDYISTSANFRNIKIAAFNLIATALLFVKTDTTLYQYNILHPN